MTLFLLLCLSFASCYLEQQRPCLRRLCRIDLSLGRPLGSAEKEREKRRVSVIYREPTAARWFERDASANRSDRRRAVTPASLSLSFSLPLSVSLILSLSLPFGTDNSVTRDRSDWKARLTINWRREMKRRTKAPAFSLYIYMNIYILLCWPDFAFSMYFAVVRILITEILFMDFWYAGWNFSMN